LNQRGVDQLLLEIKEYSEISKHQFLPLDGGGWVGVKEKG